MKLRIVKIENHIETFYQIQIRLWNPSSHDEWCNEWEWIPCRENEAYQDPDRYDGYLNFPTLEIAEEIMEKIKKYHKLKKKTIKVIKTYTIE